MRLAEFIREEMEPILQNWQEFANSLLPARSMNKTELRDHAKDMLLAIADDLEAFQSEAEQRAKSKGQEPEDSEDTWAEVHGSDRQSSGFSVMETVSEFRALRASVVSLWTKAYPSIASHQLEDLTRFHEAIDQAVNESLEQYSEKKEKHTRLFGAILVGSPDPIFVFDLNSRFIYANKATADLFALEPKAIMGKSTFDLGFSFAADFELNLKKVIADQSTYRGQFVHTFATGQGERFEYVLAPVLDEQKKIEAIVCICRDITEQALAAEKIWYNAHHDLLTGLPNRRLFMDRLEQEVKHAKRGGQTLAVLFMDLNGFKKVNDSLGHEVGDRLLASVAKRLNNCVREDDTVARLGGDEFTVIINGAKQLDDVKLVAQAALDTLAIPFNITQPPVQISASIGITFYPQDATTPNALLQLADQAMYKAKKSGPGQMCFYNQADKTNQGPE